MNCKHKNKTRLYKRMPTTWTSTELWECENCGAVLGVTEIKVKVLKTEKDYSDKMEEVMEDIQ